MAIHRLIEAALDGSPFPLYGDGDQIRDFTYVGDVVAANLAAAEAEAPPGTVVNVAGGGGVSMAELIAMVEVATGLPIERDRRPPQPGDVDRTGGSIELARELLAWEPKVDLNSGLVRQVAWHRDRPR
jgi:nucleoside-diphosphate-sugar epimerase